MRETGGRKAGFAGVFCEEPGCGLGRKRDLAAADYSVVELPLVDLSVVSRAFFGADSRKKIAESAEEAASSGRRLHTLRLGLALHAHHFHRTDGEKRLVDGNAEQVEAGLQVVDELVQAG